MAVKRTYVSCIQGALHIHGSTYPRHEICKAFTWPDGNIQRETLQQQWLGPPVCGAKGQWQQGLCQGATMWPVCVGVLGTPSRGEATQRGGHSSRDRPDFVLLLVLGNKIWGRGGGWMQILPPSHATCNSHVPRNPTSLTLKKLYKNKY
jgi:hypothetical protein